MAETTAATTLTKPVRTEMISQIRLKLGEGMIDIEPDPEHLELACTQAFERFRQRSSNSVEESIGFLDIQPEQNIYIMPNEIQSISEIYRRGVAGLATGGGSYIEPFNLAYTNLYLLRAGDQGGLATYDAFSQYQETVGRLFGLYINYTFDYPSHKLTLMRKPTAAETVAMRMWNYKPEQSLWGDDRVRPWLRDYATAQTKLMISEARGLFSQIPGPQGGTTLNADQIKADAQQDLERLETEIQNLVTGETPMWWVIG